MAQAEKTNVTELNTDLATQMAVLREDIAALTAVVSDYGKAQGAELKSMVANKAAALADTGATAAKSAQATAKAAYSDAEEAIRDNPTSAVGIAAGLGFLVGILLSRR